MAGPTVLAPIVSKIFCSSSTTVLMIRKRPPAAGGGGFVVVDSDQTAVFGVDGCGILGVDNKLIVRDGDGAPVLFISSKDGVVQALTFHRSWNGYVKDYEGTKRLIFSLREPKGILALNNAIKISMNSAGIGKDWDYEVKGSFLKKDFTINGRRGEVMAQVGGKEITQSDDFYYVVVQPGFDQAFVVGVIAVLDKIHGESTRC